VDDFLDHLDRDPFAQFDRWFADAHAAGLWEPEAMALATSTPDGRPSVRIVLLRARDERGFVFFTNRESRKGEELAANPKGALAFYWAPPLERQVRIEGRVEPVADDASDAYYATRPLGSRIGAWASPQSRPLGDRNELEALVAEASSRFGDDPPRPPFWGGYRLVPDAFEFWQGRPSRLHDRARFELGTERWTRTRLAP
jgi:pyridoxamine 5'-phosphate oxidase